MNIENEELIRGYFKAIEAASSAVEVGKVSDGERICAETGWQGTLAIQVGALKAGVAMRADFGVFFRIKDGTIIEQNNYDCIHPW